MKLNALKTIYIIVAIMYKFINKSKVQIIKNCKKIASCV